MSHVLMCLLLLLSLQGSSHNARLLLLRCIKLMLFFLAFVVSQSVYFAAFFGTESCFFSRTGEWEVWLGLKPLPLCVMPADLN
jgi:ABC-type uncharacterized transport system permease subunit